MIKLVCLSDTHCQLNKIEIPEGNILLHSGDLTYSGDVDEITNELYKLGKLKSRFDNIIVVAGNHDWLGQTNPSLMKQLCDDNKIDYLMDSGCTTLGLKFWGSPWQPEFFSWAFNLPRGEELTKKWDLIPEDTQVLLTHGPPYAILDIVMVKGVPQHLGCEALAARLPKLKQLKLHSFGHLHLQGGQTMLSDGVTFVNAAMCDERYKPNRSPVVVNLTL